MKIDRLSTLGFLVFSIVLSLSACKKKGDNNNLNKISIDSDSLKIAQKIEQAKEIFYSLPAPHEVSSFLMDNKGSYFNNDLLNPLSNADKYSSEASLAYNLGVYSADLSYASLFNQNQIVIDYMAKAKVLADQLGILNAFDQETIDKLQENINNRDSIMQIISETFMNSDAYLQENDRQDVGAMILIGGWIEGMYVAVELSEKNVKKNVPLTSSILEQKLSLELMNDFLKNFPPSNGLNIIKKEITDLYNFFEKIDTPVTNDGYLTTSPENFKQLCLKIENIRNKIINLS